MSDEIERMLSGSSTSDVRAEQIRQLSNFYTLDDSIDMKTELTNQRIERMNCAESVEAFLIKEWDIELGYREDNVREMAKLVSHSRRGREEAISVLKQNIELIDQKSGAEKVLIG